MKKARKNFFRVPYAVFLCLFLYPAGNVSADAPPSPAGYTINPKPIRSILGHADNISRVALIQDGKAVMTASKDKVIKIWDTTTGEKIRSLFGHQDFVISHDIDEARGILASGDHGGEVIVWDFQAGKMLKRLPVDKDDIPSRPGALCFDPAGKILAVGRWNSTIELWNWEKKKKIKTLGVFFDKKGKPYVKDESEGIVALQFDSEGRWIYAGYRSGEIKKWDTLTTWKEYILGEKEDKSTILFKIPGEVGAMKMSKDNKWLAAGSTRKKIVVFDLEKNQVSWEKKIHKNTVNHLTFLGDESVIASGGSDRQVILSSVDNGKILASITLSSDVRAVAVHDKSSTLAAASGIHSGKEVSLFHWVKGESKQPDFQDLVPADQVITEAAPHKQPSPAVSPALPPVILVSHPQQNMEIFKDRVTLSGVIRLYHKKGLSSFKVIVNKKEYVVLGERGVIVKEKIKQRTDYTQIPFQKSIPLAAGNNHIVVSVVDGKGIEAKENIMVKRSVNKGQMWVAIIGIDRFADKKIPDLKYAVADAKLMANYFKNYLELDNHHLITLFDEKATLKNIKTVLGTELKKKASTEDTVIIYFAGHGAPEVDADSPDGDGFEKYILTHDTVFSDLYSTALPMREITNIFGRIKSERLIFIADTCFSGAAGGRTLARPGIRSGTINDKFWDRVSKGKGRVILSASAASEFSQEKKELGHGVFTYYLVDGMKGKADQNNDTFINVDELFFYVSKKVPSSTSQNQHPVKKGEFSGEVIIGRY